MSITLRGITWNHTRGLVPLQATAQRYSELHPEVEIVWEKRTLKAFEEYPIQKLAETYDLLVIDHPFVGYAAKHGTLLPLDEHLSAEYLQDQAANSVGVSHESYYYDTHQWALAVDAAAPVAIWRPDLLELHQLEVPTTWNEVLELARHGMVELPAAPINCLMNFYMLCIACGAEPFTNKEQVINSQVGNAALEQLKELVTHCSPECLSRNPIQSCEIMAKADNTHLVYCPLAYGYSNYSREGYAEHLLHFGDIPKYNHSTSLHSTLGGTGLAISALTTHRNACLDYASYVANSLVQRTLYTRSGGQPGYRAAWLDAENNRITSNYFTNTLPTLDRAYLRPRYCGYLEFQDTAGPVVHDYLRGKLDAKKTLQQLDTLYVNSLEHA